MTTDLQLLLWAAALTVVQMLIGVVTSTAQVGLPTLAGNREGLAPLTGLAGRARRAHANMLESLALFAILVLVAQVAGRANSNTALGAEIFFWSRVAFAVIYVAGIPWLRTVAFVASMAGLGLIFLQLI